MKTLKAVRYCTIQVLVPEENWDTFEAAVMAAGQQYGTVKITREGVSTGSLGRVGGLYIERGGMTMYARRTELANKDG